MSENTEQKKVNEQQKNVRKPKTGKKHRFNGKKIAALLLATGIAIGGSAQASYNVDSTERAVTEKQLEDIRKSEEISELNELGVLIESDKISDLAKAGEIAEKYNDVEKLKSLRDTYVQLLKQTVANTYGIDVEKVKIDSDKHKIELVFAENEEKDVEVKQEIYTKDFITTIKEEPKEIGKQTLALMSGHTMSSEFSTGLKDANKLDELIEKCEKGEMKVSETKEDVKEIYEHIAIFKIAKSKSNGKNIELEYPETEKSKNASTDKNKEQEGMEPGE